MNKGYDFSILPQELKYSKEETEDVLDHLQNKNQRLYVFTGLVYTYAESKEALDTQVLRIISTARQNSIELDTYDYRQRQGLNSILPLGHNHVEISRMFTTAQVSILVPFATQELDDAGGNFYGQNKHSRNLVVCNRKKLTSPMGFVCGKTGSGKGMFTKTEMTGTIFSNPTDEIYVIDRAGEYTAIAERYGGSTYHFGVGTGTHLNPFDTVSVEHMTRNEQIAFKVDAMLAQAGASAAEAGSNFSEVDQSLVQRCTELAFQKAAERGDNLPPTLQDFYDAANEQPEEQAQVIALRYERFVKGSMNFFNHQSNVDFNTRIVDFNLKDLPDSMLVFALMDFSSYYYYIPLNFYETPEMTLIDHEPNGDSATVLVLALAKIHTRTVTKNDDGTFTIVTDDGTFTDTEVMEMLSSFGYRANHAKYTHALAVVARFPPFDHLAYSEAERDKKTPEVYQ